jgi:hypothetical protein
MNVLLGKSREKTLESDGRLRIFREKKKIRKVWYLATTGNILGGQCEILLRIKIRKRQKYSPDLFI